MSQGDTATASPPIHHVGLLVPDLPAAVDLLGAALGRSFLPPRRVTSQHRVDPGEFGDEEPHESTSFISWSTSGPPYYELIEGKPVPAGLLSIAVHGTGLHHVGMFVPDVDAEIRRLASLGIAPQTRALTEDGRTLCCWTHPTPGSGLIFEYIEEAARPAVQQWIETGAGPQVAGAVR
jgi:catechol 2,3-dioxygenase-like lactoylglutathione lyase family enzyme